MGFLNTTFIGMVVVLVGFFLLRMYTPNTTNTVAFNKVIVVGGGLAGMSAALEAHKRGATVILLEKEPRLGGNSAKASSGINAVGTIAQHTAASTDTIEAFVSDTLASGGGTCEKDLVQTIATQSAEAVSFLTSLGVDLSVLSRCGGHSHARTHRAGPPPPGQFARNIGFEITSKLIDSLNKTSSVQLILGARVKQLKQASGRVVGVTYLDREGHEHELTSDAVVLAAGGFGADRGASGLLEKYGGATLAHLPTTNGPWATGDGVRLAEAVGAKMVLMDQVQIHPTGFVDPKDPVNPTKFLAPEALRAVGGILVNKAGKRFVNELSLRNQVAPAIFAHGFRISANGDGERGDAGKELAAAFMLLSDESVNAFGTAALKFYMSKGFIVKYASAEEFASKAGVDKDALLQTIEAYNAAAAKGGPDEFGKTTFPATFDASLPVNVLTVTPSIHYTMGGALITTSASVVRVDGSVIPGLYAAGEASGGVHGNNRLAGNSLLECVVFGRIAGEHAATLGRL